MKLYTQGTFDLFHYGHVAFLKRCKALAGDDKVIVALLTDEVIEEYKGHPPIMKFKERAAVLRACKYVDEVFPSDNKKTSEEIEILEPDIVVVGSDWAKKDIYKQYQADREWLNKFLVYLPYTESISTTELKRRIKHGKI